MKKVLINFDWNPSSDVGIERETTKNQNLFFYKNIDVFPLFWCHIVLYIQQTFILTTEIPRKITKKYKCKSYGSYALHVI